VTGLVPAQRCFDRPETLAERLEAARHPEGEPGKAASARVVRTVSIAGPRTRPASRIRAHRAGDMREAAAELPTVRPMRDFAEGLPMPARAAE
jgi:hypothetical protein